jgi:transposase
VPEATACPPSVVADTIMRTIELGVTITDAAVDEKRTTIFCAPVARIHVARTAAGMGDTATP